MDRNLKSVGIALAATLLSGVAAAQTVKEGQPAPMITVNNLAGDQITLKDMEKTGAPIFLFFINTQDNTSSAAAGYINRIAAAYVPSKTKWYGICNGPADSLRAYQSELNPPYQLMLDNSLASMQAFRAQASPTVAEISGDGTVMHLWVGYSASMLKHLNRAVALANGKKPAPLDFSRCPETTMFGHPYIGGH
jgi:peroxiredoxin